MTTNLLIIDPQNDFMDTKDATLPVKGAKDDMKRLSSLISKLGNKITNIHVTLDSHNKVQIFHPCFWQDQNGNEPLPFTVISYEDVKNKLYVPKNSNLKLEFLNYITLYEYCLNYTKYLKEQGLYSLTIWPYHCLIGTNGHAIEQNLLQTLLKWEEENLKTINYIFKGNNFITEHYGALHAEYQITSKSNTTLNHSLLNKLISANTLLIAGQASSHCVLSTIKQIVANINSKDLPKLCILADCMSPVLAPNNEPNFVKIVDDYFKTLALKGVNIKQSLEFL